MSEHFDIIIVGGGPAGLTAAVYGLRAGKTVLVIEKGGFGGQIAFSPKVENIPGFAEISQYLTQADARYVNLETTLHRGEFHANQFSGGSRDSSSRKS